MGASVMASNDTPDLGRDQYSDFMGVSVADPRVSARARVGIPGGYDVDSGRAKFITSDTPAPDALAGIPGVEVLDDWRDAFNPQSPAFWLLLMILGVVGLLQLRVALGGSRGVRAGIG